MSCNSSEDTAVTSCPYGYPAAAVKTYPVPAGVQIRPISEGGRGKMCDGTNPPAPKISGACPMAQSKSCNKSSPGKIMESTTGFFSKIGSWFGF